MNNKNTKEESVRRMIKEIFMLSELGGPSGTEKIGTIDYSTLTIMVTLTPHAVSNLNRSDNIGPPITRPEIMRLVKAALPKVVTALATQEIQLGGEFVITSKKSHLNLPATFESSPGRENTYELRGITTMRKMNFKPNRRGEKQFTVMSEWIVKTYNQELKKALNERYDCHIVV